MAAVQKSLIPIPPSDDIPQYKGDAPYKGPSPGWLIKNNKLAHQIISTHTLAPANVLDPPELALLKRYVNDPSPSAAQKLLEERDMLDTVEPEGAKKGIKAQKKYGSLVGYVIANEGLSEEEIELLKVWFETPEMVKELDGVEATGGGKGVHDENA